MLLPIIAFSSRNLIIYAVLFFDRKTWLIYLILKADQTWIYRLKFDNVYGI